MNQFGHLAKLLIILQLSSSSLSNFPEPITHPQHFYQSVGRHQVPINPYSGIRQNLPLKEAQDRYIKWFKLIKKKKKKKFKKFKKQFKHCGFPHKLKIIRKIDNGDYDTLKIQMDNGQEIEFYPKLDKIDDDQEIAEDLSFAALYFNKTLPLQPIRRLTRINPKRITPKRKPWPLRTSWKIAPPGKLPGEYILLEPLPGVFSGSPPAQRLFNYRIKTKTKQNRNKLEDNIGTESQENTIYVPEPNGTLYRKGTKRADHVELWIVGEKRLPVTESSINRWNQMVPTESQIVTSTPSNLPVIITRRNMGEDDKIPRESEVAVKED